MQASGYLHADDIRTLAANPSNIDAQVSAVTKFTDENFLKLNASKCEVVILDHEKSWGELAGWRK